MQGEKVTTFYQEIGIRIREARTVNGISQEIFALQLNLTRASIINIEKGRHRPSLHMLIIISNVLQIDYTALIPRPDTNPLPKKINLSNIISDEKLSKSTQETIKAAIATMKS